MEKARRYLADVALEGKVHQTAVEKVGSWKRPLATTWKSTRELGTSGLMTSG